MEHAINHDQHTHEHRDDEFAPTGKPAAYVKGDDVGIKIFSEPGSDWCRLEWTDYVANDWHEHLPSRTLAMLRMAHLIQVVERDEMMVPIDTFIAQHAGLVN